MDRHAIARSSSKCWVTLAGKMYQALKAIEKAQESVPQIGSPTATQEDDLMEAGWNAVDYAYDQADRLCFARVGICA